MFLTSSGHSPWQQAWNRRAILDFLRKLKLCRNGLFEDQGKSVRLSQLSFSRLQHSARQGPGPKPSQTPGVLWMISGPKLWWTHSVLQMTADPKLMDTQCAPIWPLILNGDGHIGVVNNLLGVKIVEHKLLRLSCIGSGQRTSDFGRLMSVTGCKRSCAHLAEFAKLRLVCTHLLLLAVLPNQVKES